MSRSSSIQRPFFTILLLLCAYSIYSISPQINSSVLKIEVSEQNKSLAEGDSLSVEELLATINGLKKAVNTYPSSSNLKQLVLATTSFTKQVKDPTQLGSLKVSSDFYKEGLARGPISPYFWARQAVELSQKPTRGLDAVEAWAASVHSAPYEPYLIRPRIHVGIGLYQFMDSETRALLRQQVHLGYDWNYKAMSRYAQNNGLVGWFLFFLNDKPERVQKLEAYIRELQS